MFSLEPYHAERQVSGLWKPCRVIGVLSAAYLSPQFVVEYAEDGYTCLALEEFIRRPEPSNPS